MSKRSALTDRQRRFVDEHLIDANATQAAMRAGYSRRTARAQGSRLLTNADIRREIERRSAALSERARIDAAWVLRRLAIEAEREGPGSSHSARVSALRHIARHPGMFDEPAERDSQNDLAALFRQIRENGGSKAPIRSGKP